MKIKEVTIFICDHCQKKAFNKGAMTRHENLCNSNPENWRACSGCVHCEETTHTYISKVFDGEYSGEGMERQGTTFKCKVFNKLMYPFKAEKKGLIKRFPETFANQEPMPKICKYRKVIPEHQYGYYAAI